MAAVVPLCQLISISPAKLSKEENLLLEAELFTRLCEALEKIFRERHQEYFSLMKLTIEMEKTMLEANFITLIINDILATEEYTLEGIAHYTDTPEDVMQEIVTGYNKNPSAMLLRRVIDLHRSVRRNLYEATMKKIAEKYLLA